jgi:molybdopterin molybdotransferase
LGQAELQVKRRLRVAFFSTGDELRSLGQALDEGCLYDSNRYTIWGMLQRLGFVELMDMGVVRDNASSLEAAFREASACADAIVTSGGVSVVEADHTKQVMAALGDVVFWRIAMRPGRPMAIGRIQDGAILFGLPGNPVAVMVTFYAFVRPALMQMAGVQGLPLTMLRARCLTPMRKKPGRTEYQRGIVTCAADGVWQVRITGAQGSGILSSMSAANGLVVLPHESGNVAEGDEVDVWPFEGLA